MTRRAAARSWPRRLVRLAARLLGGLLALLALLLGALHTGPAKERLRQRIEGRLSERVNGSVTLERLDYLLFFGDLEIAGLAFRDESGAPQISLGRLRVAPAWGALLSGEVVLDAVEVEAPSIRIAKDAEGGSNLQRLFRKRLEAPDRLITVRSLRLSDVQLVVAQPDGTRFAIEDLDVAAALALSPKQRTGSVQITSLELDLSLDKGAGGLKLGVSDLRAAIGLELDRGRAKVHVDPVHGAVRLGLPGRAPHEFPLDLAGLDLRLDEGELDAALTGVAASAVALASLEVRVRRDAEGRLVGEQGGDVIGLRLERSRLSALLGREILASDVEAELHLAGPAEAIETRLRVRSGEAAVSLDGTLGPALVPTFDLRLSIDRVDTAKLLAPEMASVPSVAVGHLEISAKGRGATLPSADATVRLSGERLAVRGIAIERLEADARLAGGVVDTTRLAVRALGQDLRGRARFVPATKELDLHLSLAGDPSEALDGLRAAGRPISTRLPPGAVVVPEEGIVVDARGRLDGPVAVTVRAPAIQALGGRLALDARATVHREPEGSEKKVRIEDLGASVDVRGVRLSRVLALRGRAAPVDAALGLHVELEGPLERPAARFAVDVADARVRGLHLSGLHVSAKGRATKHRVTVDLVATGGEREELLVGHASVPLTEMDGKPRPSTSGPFALRLALAERSLRELVVSATGAPLLGAAAPDAKARLAVDLSGTLARPAGTVELGGEGTLLGDVRSKLALRGAMETSAEGRPSVDLVADAWLDARAARTLRLEAKASIARSPLSPGPREPRWAARVELGPIDLAKLPDLSPRVPRERLERLRALGGVVRAELAFAGDEEDATGHADLAVRGLGGPGTPVGAPLDLALRAEVKPDHTTVDVDLDAVGGRLLEIAGRVGLAGEGLLAELRAGRRPDPTLDLDVDVPARPLASLAPLRPALASAPGTLAGHLDVGGRARAPTVKGAIGVSGIASASGGETGAGLAIDAGEERIEAAVTLGPDGALGRGPVVLRAGVPRAGLSALEEGGAPLDVKLSAAAVPVAELLPKLASTDRGLPAQGRLDADLELRGTLLREQGALRLAAPRLSGGLELSAPEIALPGARRAFRQVALVLRAEEGALRLERLHAEESDLEKPRRSIDVEGAVRLDGLRPRSATVAVRAQDWLLFGRSLGKADAPRGTLTLDAAVEADLSGPIRKVDVDVRRLAALIPDRFEKAHQPEEVHVGDVLFVGDPGVTPGKLPVPESVRAAASAAPPPADDGSGTDVHLAIRRGARVLSSPIDLSPEGSLDVSIRPSGRTVRGRLEMRGGELSLGGKMHPLERGALVFDEAHPKGEIDLWFARPLERHQLRDVSKASAGEAIRIHMMGPIDDRKTVLSGAGSPGALFDLLAMHNAGHPRFVTEPDLPDTGSVEFQPLGEVLILSFLSVNLPHLLFLDRSVAWSDPYDDVRRYGRVDNFEGERTDGALRVRGTGRAQQVGRSNAEVGVDYLFVDTPTFLFGTGVTAGSRLGGGPGVFLEWSSED